MSFTDLITQYGWQTFIAVDFLIFITVVYFVKERQENKRIEAMQTNQVPLEMRTNEKDEVTDKIQPKKNSHIKRTIISAGGFSASQWTNKNTSQIILSQAMIGQLRSFHSAGFLIQKMVKLVIPEEIIEALVDKALKNELKPGMKVKVKNGELEIEGK
jgi:hypothetical protein